MGWWRGEGEQQFVAPVSGAFRPPLPGTRNRRDGRDQYRRGVMIFLDWEESFELGLSPAY